ncbi:unnamed protein product [Lampetra planeri]
MIHVLTYRISTQVQCQGNMTEYKLKGQSCNYLFTPLLAEGPPCGGSSKRPLSTGHMLVNFRILYCLHTNQLQALPAEVFDRIVNLKEIGACGQISALPAGVFDSLKHLANSHLQYNQLSALPGLVFDKLTQLTVLNLRHNQLKSVPAGTFERLVSL